MQLEAKQWPALQSPLQHSEPDVHAAPFGAQTLAPHTPPVQRPEQHWVPTSQGLPFTRHACAAQKPAGHAPLQHCTLELHGLPLGTHCSAAQAPLLHKPLQQEGRPVPHEAPLSAQAAIDPPPEPPEPPRPPPLDTMPPPVDDDPPPEPGSPPPPEPPTDPLTHSPSRQLMPLAHAAHSAPEAPHCALTSPGWHRPAESQQPPHDETLQEGTWAPEQPTHADDAKRMSDARTAG
jgi:hypothetical protein